MHEHIHSATPVGNAAGRARPSSPPPPPTRCRAARSSRTPSPPRAHPVTRLSLCVLLLLFRTRVDTWGAGGLLVALRTLLTEVERVRVHGFSDREVDIVVSNYLTELKTTYLERHQLDSADLADEIVSHFVAGELLLGVETEVIAEIELRSRRD